MRRFSELIGAAEGETRRPTRLFLLLPAPRLLFDRLSQGIHTFIYTPLNNTLMSNQERLDQLIQHIDELAKLVNSIRGMEIYPVSFFSSAFDLTGKMQVDLHEMEIGQIELFDRQLREHREQIRAFEAKARPSFEAPAPEHASPTPPPAPQADEEEPIMRPTPMPAPVPEPQPDPAPTPEPTPVQSQTPQAPANTTPKPTPIPVPKMAPAPLSHADTSLNDAIERTKLTDLRKAFTLNDRFRFCRELFDRDEARMNDTLSALNEAHSYSESLDLLRARVQWDFDGETATDFLKFIERRFV